MSRSAFLFLFVVTTGLHAQHGPHLPDPRAGRPLDHEAGEEFRRLGAARCSEDGAWLAWVESPFDGDSELIVASSDGSKTFRRSCGSAPRFTKDGLHVLFTIAPTREAERAHALEELQKKERKERERKKPEASREQEPGPAKGAEKKPEAKKKSKNEKPLPSLGILELQSGKIRVIPGVRSWTHSDAAPGIVLYTWKGPEKDAELRLFRYDLKERKATGSWEGVSGLVLAKDDEHFYFRQEERAARPAKKAKKPKAEDVPARPRRVGGLFVASLDGAPAVLLHESQGEFEGPWLDEERRRVVWMHQPRSGDESKFEKKQWPRQRSWELWHRDANGAAERLLAGSDELDVQPGLLLSPDRRPLYSRDAGRILVGVRARPAAEPRPQLPEDVVELDLWHWRDPRLQTHQRKQRSARARRTRAAVFHMDEKRLVVLSPERVGSASFLDPRGERVWWADPEPYAQRVSWDSRYQDVYVADTVSGSVQRVLTDVRNQVSASRDGRYLLRLGRDGHWYGHDLEEGDEHCLTAGLGVSFVDELQDRPTYPRAYGVLGWAAGDAYVYLYDRYDVWRVQPRAEERVCLTAGHGRETGLRFRRVRLDPEEKEIDPEQPMLLSTFDEESMASGFYRFDPKATEGGLRRLVLKHARFGRNVLASADQSRLFVSVSRYDVPNDYWVSDADFENMRRLSNSNPQQADYRWGKAELVRWRGLGGQQLKGVLVKPDGFDPRRKYPMMVYFYERRSHRLHDYVLPHPGTSPSASFYVSRGYLWFVPDIHYQIGRPGQSALDCVVPGVLSLVRKGYVDPKRIGVAGHSWGGYQVSYLVTRTPIFAAAEAGAPVSNMTSAYGGIRWGSGLSRMFQYERTQSRIGGTLWEKPGHYLENSPLFRADEVETPLLILHNDEDGAVPWYQGIELFVALRRLQKEAYLFNYNGEAHGLRRKATRRDWARRMQEFFDHHLRDTPAPTWMREGVPHAERMREKSHRRRAEEALRAQARRPPQPGTSSPERASEAGELGGAGSGRR